MKRNHWRLTLQRWDLTDEGFGTVIYRLETPNQIYQLVVFSNQIKDEERNDRVIAEKWDVTSVLTYEINDEKYIEKLRNSVPLQEVGRNDQHVLVLFRANKSVRVFNHILDTLSVGRQPDIDKLAEVGYLLRTTAVYGNGKFGISDFSNLQDNKDFSLSFCAQMCAVYLLREFSFDWIDFLAEKKGKSQSVKLHPKLKRYLGIGNATGLGMSLFLLRHPRIIDNWVYQRELALSEAVRESITSKKKKRKLFPCWLEPRSTWTR